MLWYYEAAPGVVWRLRYRPGRQFCWEFVA